MARIFPAVVADDHGSHAERRVIEAIRDQTPESWVAIHSLGLVGHATKRWAEIDVVLVCELGVFCLEVKGGAIAHRAGEWTQNGEGLRESPFAQAGGAEAPLRAYLRKQVESSLTGVVMGYGVVLPDVRFDVSSPEVAPAVVYDARDERQPFARYVERLAAHWNAEKPWRGPRPAFTTPARTRVLHALAPTFDLVPSLRGIVDRTAAEFVRLSDEQTQVLDGLAGCPRVVVRGGAGTGKTLIAVREARRLAESGLRTAYTCFNRRLAESLIPVLEGTGVDVVHAHGLMGRFVEEAEAKGVAQPVVVAPGERAAYFDEVLPMRALEAVEQLDRYASYDALVVDEAQDLLKAPVLTFLDAILRGELRDGTWRAFLDPHQTIFGGDAGETLDELESRAVPYRLTRNLRNTGAVAAAASAVIGVAAPPTMVDEGPPVVERAYTDDAGLVRELRAQIVAWTAGDVEPHDILVLAPKGLGKLPLTGANLSRPIHDVSRGAAPVPGHVRFSTIQGFKGLEADVVIVTGFRDLGREGARELLYVGATRARVALCLLMDERAGAVRVAG